MYQVKGTIPQLLLVLVVSLLPFSGQASAAVKIGQLAPALRVTTTSGQIVTLANYRGRVLLIDFFASWCQPCRLSVPHLVEMNRTYGRQGLQVLGLSADEDGERAIRAFTNEFHVNYPVALAGEVTMADFGVRSVPVMFVLDKKGKVAEVYRGYTDEMGRSVEQLIKRLLAE
jgi:peroxiredoxin